MEYVEWIDHFSFQSSPGAVLNIVQQYVADQTMAGGGWEPTTFLLPLALEAWRSDI